MLNGNVDKLLSYYHNYIQLVKKLKIYQPDCGNLPACAHVRTWRNKLNILHLNTTLIADGKNKNGQLVDIYTATSDEIRRKLALGNLPCIAIGHNSFFDLIDNHQTVLSAMFFQENISAYLCGDRHKTFSSRTENKIELSSKYDSVRIPNIVSYRSSTDENDTYSDFGMIWQNWDEESGQVTLEFMKWNPEDQADLQIEGAKDKFNFRKDLRKSNYKPDIKKEEHIKTKTNIKKSNKENKEINIESNKTFQVLKKKISKVNHHKIQFSMLFIFICLFGVGVWYCTSKTQNERIVQKTEKKPIEEDYVLRKNEDGLWELDMSEMNLSNINFFEQYNVSKIQELNLSNNFLLNDISIIKNFSNLKRLDLSNTSIADASVVKKLLKLEMLKLSCTEINDIKFVKPLHKLRTLNVSSCKNLKNVAIVSELPNLRELNISQCENDKIWQSMPILPQLEELLIGGYEFKGQFDFALYPSLTALFIYECDLKNFSSLQSLQKLKILNVMDTMIDFTGIEKLTSLEELRFGIFFPNNANKLQHLENIKHLKLKSLIYLSQEKEIPHTITHMTNLEKLSIIAQEASLKNVSFLKNNLKLKKLELNCKIEGNLSEIGKLRLLEELSISDENFSDSPSHIFNLSFLKQCTKLEKLELNFKSVQDISFLYSCKLLKELVLKIGGLQDFSAMEDLPDLIKLEIGEISDIKDFSFLKRLEKLQELTINDAGLANFHGISRLTNLKKLSIPNADILNTDFLNNLVNIEYLDLSGEFDSEKEGFDDISFVKEMKKLKTLNLSHRKIKDLSPLKNLKQLLALDLSYTNINTDISVLSQLNNLNILNLQEHKIKDLAPLVSLRYLGSLNIAECFFGTKAEWDFMGFANLKELNVSGSTISSLDWLSKDVKLCSINVTDTMMDDLYAQIKSIIKGRQKCTIEYDVSAITTSQLIDLKKINPTCIWEARDY